MGCVERVGAGTEAGIVLGKGLATVLGVGVRCTVVEVVEGGSTEGVETGAAGIVVLKGVVKGTVIGAAACPGHCPEGISCTEGHSCARLLVPSSMRSLSP